jgi:hypothetical protein
VPLAAYRLLAADDPLSRLVLEPVLAGVASRRQLRIGESVGVTVAAAATSTSRSAISRRFVAQTRIALAGGHLDRRGPVVSGEGVPAAEAGHIADVADDGRSDDRADSEQPGQAGPGRLHGDGELLPGLADPGVDAAQSSTNSAASSQRAVATASTA